MREVLKSCTVKPQRTLLRRTTLHTPKYVPSTHHVENVKEETSLQKKRLGTRLQMEMLGNFEEAAMGIKEPLISMKI